MSPYYSLVVEQIGNLHEQSARFNEVWPDEDKIAVRHLFPERKRVDEISPHLFRQGLAELSDYQEALTGKAANTASHSRSVDSLFSRATKDILCEKNEKNISHQPVIARRSPVPERQGLCYRIQLPGRSCLCHG